MSRSAAPLQPLRDVGCLWPVVGAAAGLTSAVLLIMISAAVRGARVQQLAATPALVRVPAPTATATLEPTSVPPTPTVTDPAGGGEEFRVGDLAEVFGTQGDGVRLRSAPSLDGTVVGLGQDGQVFQVTDGPGQGSGRVWWYVVNIQDSSLQGWAAAEFLRPLQSP